MYRGVCDTEPMASDHRALFAQQTTEALIFVLGMLAAKPLRREEAGRFAALADELKTRGVWDAMLSTLDPDLAANVRMLVVVDRGQHLVVHGQRSLV